MKKTLLAVTIAAATAMTANAATIYEADGTKFTMGAEAKVHLAKEKKADNSMKLDQTKLDGRITLGVTHQLNDTLYAIGGMRLRAKTGDSVATDRLYAGFGFTDIGTLTFGKQANSVDGVILDVGNIYDGWLPVYKASSDDTDFDGFYDVGAKTVQFASADFGGFQGKVSYEFGNRDSNNPTVASDPKEMKNRAEIGAFYEGNVADDVVLKANAGYQEVKYYGDAKKFKSYAVAAGVEAYGLTANLNYHQLKQTDVKKAKGIMASVAYQFTPELQAYTQYGQIKFKDGQGTTIEKTRSYMLGAEYAFSKNVKTYAEYAYTKAKEADAKFRGFGVGLKVVF